VVVIPTRAENRREETSVDRRGDEQQTKNTSGMSNAQKRGKKDIKSRDEICRPDFPSPFMVTGQVGWWCVGRRGR
jgi:hypothetical protein